jgi:alpha-L-fucosidase 2
MPSGIISRMDKWKPRFLIVLSLSMFVLAWSADSRCEDMKIWFRQPAKDRNETLALGNGRLGALVYGDVSTERLQLSEDTIWANEPNSKNREGAKENLYKARQLLFDGEYGEAHDLINSKVLYPPGRCYMTLLGDLRLHFRTKSEVTHYRRELDFDTAVATVTYKRDGATFTRSAFISPVDQVLAIRLTCDRPGQISFGTELSCELYATTETEGDDVLVMTGSTYPETNGLLYEACIVSEKGGPLKVRCGAEIWNFQTRPGQELRLPVAAR